MKFWREVAQRRVYSQEWGFGVVTAERSDGVLGVQFDSDPWVVHHLDPSEVEEAKQASFLLVARSCPERATFCTTIPLMHFFLRENFFKIF